MWHLILYLVASCFCFQIFFDVNTIDFLGFFNNPHEEYRRALVAESLWRCVHTLLQKGQSMYTLETINKYFTSGGA
jgi:hypothetical protein